MLNDQGFYYSTLLHITRGELCRARFLHQTWQLFDWKRTSLSYALPHLLSIEQQRERFRGKDGNVDIINNERSRFTPRCIRPAHNRNSECVNPREALQISLHHGLAPIPIPIPLPLRRVEAKALLRERRSAVFGEGFDFNIAGMRRVLHAVGGCKRAAEVEGVEVEVVGDGVAHEAGPCWGPDLLVRVERVVDDGFWGRFWEETGWLDVFEWRVIDRSNYDNISDGALFVAAIVKLYEGQ